MSWTRRASLVAAGWLVATALAAQTTGRIEGRIVDDAGALLPGVAVVATGPSLPGEARTQSADDGSFRLVNLPPGVYTVAAALDGFNSVEQRDVKVGIDRTVSLEMTMVAAFTGEVTVLSEAPEAMRSPSGAKATQVTLSECPSRVRSAWPVWASQRRTVLSQPPVTRRLPSRL